MLGGTSISPYHGGRRAPAKYTVRSGMRPRSGRTANFAPEPATRAPRGYSPTPEELNQPRDDELVDVSRHLFLGQVTVDELTALFRRQVCPLHERHARAPG